MVGFRRNKGYCSFGCHVIRSEVPGRVSGELGPKTFGAIPSHWEWRISVTVEVTEKDSDTGVFRVGSGGPAGVRTQGGTLSERNKGLWRRGAVGNTVFLGFLGLWVSCFGFDTEGLRTVDD